MLQRITGHSLRVILIIRILQARNLMLVLDNSKEFRNWVLREINLYLVTFVLPLGMQKRRSFIFHYSSNFTCGLSVAS